LDNDGDLDLINVNMESFVYQNNSEKQEKNHIKVKLKETIKINLLLEVLNYSLVKKFLRQELIPSRGFQSSIDYVIFWNWNKKLIHCGQMVKLKH
jgi:hypothetical protein